MEVAMKINLVSFVCLAAELRAIEYAVSKVQALVYQVFGSDAHLTDIPDSGWEIAGSFFHERTETEVSVTGPFRNGFHEAALYVTIEHYELSKGDKVVHTHDFTIGVYEWSEEEWCASFVESLTVALNTGVPFLS
jgi:hypothetical protein